MNIFYLDDDTRQCAEYMVDSHVVKMILEYCQLLSTAHRVLDGHEVIEKTPVKGSVPPRFRNVKRWRLDDDREKIMYSATHVNHPSAVWTRQSKENYGWLVDMLKSTIIEYTYRYDKVHKCALLYPHLIDAPRNIPIAKFTQPTPAMPDDCKVPGDSIASYRNYYIRNKVHLHKWKKREVPDWMENVNADLRILQ
jgi:hypothetical protein